MKTCGEIDEITAMRYFPRLTKWMDEKLTEHLVTQRTFTLQLEVTLQESFEIMEHLRKMRGAS